VHTFVGGHTRKIMSVTGTPTRMALATTINIKEHYQSMAEKFTRKSLEYPLGKLNKQIENSGSSVRFEIYGEQVGTRHLYSLQEVSHGTVTLIPRGTAREIFYALNALSTTLEWIGFRAHAGVISA